MVDFGTYGTKVLTRGSSGKKDGQAMEVVSFYYLLGASGLYGLIFQGGLHSFFLCPIFGVFLGGLVLVYNLYLFNRLYLLLIVVPGNKDGVVRGLYTYNFLVSI